MPDHNLVLIHILRVLSKADTSSDTTRNGTVYFCEDHNLKTYWIYFYRLEPKVGVQRTQERKVQPLILNSDAMSKPLM